MNKKTGVTAAKKVKAQVDQIQQRYVSHKSYVRALVSSHRMSYRGYSRFLTAGVVLSLCLCGASFAAEPQMVSKKAEVSPAPATEPILPKIESVKKAAVKTPKIDLPGMSKEDAEAKGEIKKLKGKVAGINNYGVAVEYNDGAREMWADFMKETKLEGVKKFRDLEMGDTVEITYKELKTSSKRLLQKVHLVRRKPKELEAVETEPAPA